MFSKVAAFLALFAVVSAQSFGSIAVQTQNGDTVVINQNTQHQVRIATNPLSSWGTQQTIKVQVAGPAIPPKTVQIVDQQVDTTGTQQSDILNQLLSSFNGRLGEDSYQQLLNVVAQQVATGQVNPIVLNALQTASNSQQIVQSGIQQLIQNAISQQQGGFQGQWQQNEITQQIKTQQVKQALLSQIFGGAGNQLGTVQAELEAEQAAQALEGNSPQSQTAKRVLISQALAASGNPVSAAQAELAAEQSAQTLQAVNPQSQLAKKVLISKALTQSGNKLAAAQVQLEAAKLAQIVSQQQGGFQGQWHQDELAQQIKTQQIKQALLNQEIGGVGNSQAAVQAGLEAEQAAQSLEGITPQSQTAKQVLISQVLAASGNPVAAAQAELAAEQSAQTLQAVNPQSQLAKKVLISKALTQSGNKLAAAQVQLEAAKLAQIVSQQQGGFQGQWHQDKLAQQIKIQQIKQALLNQQIGGVGSSQAVVQAGLEAEQAAQSLEGTTPQSQTAKQVLISQVLAASGNPVAAAQAQLAAEQSAEALQAVHPQSQLAKKVLISKVLAQSGNPLAAAEAQFEAAEEAQIVAAIESQGQLGVGGVSQLSGAFGVGSIGQSRGFSPISQAQLSRQVYGPGFGVGSSSRSLLSQTLGLSQIQQQAAAAGVRGLPVIVY